MSQVPFVEFPKIPRLKRDCVITEKIDGSNAQIHITKGEHRIDALFDPSVVRFATLDGVEYILRAGSRSRWITPGKETDNFGFAAWVYDHGDELVALGEGSHFGEWYGAGIQRTYDLPDRRFALFNTARWNPDNPNKPACCEVVPVLYTGAMGDAEEVVEELRQMGSVHVPGYKYPEGVVVYHTASRQLFKQLIENDDRPKTAANDPGERKPRDPNKGGRRVGLTPGYAGPERRAA